MSKIIVTTQLVSDACRVSFEDAVDRSITGFVEAGNHVRDVKFSTCFDPETGQIWYSALVICESEEEDGQDDV